jgi:hypothetical protein
LVIRFAPPLAPVTARFAVALWVAELPAPVTVKVADADAAPDAAVRVSVLEPPAVTEAGLNEPVTPAGSPLSASDTACALPEVTAVLTVNEVEAPALTLPEAGLIEIEKSLVAGALTVRLAVALCVAEAPAPVTVKVALADAALAAAVRVSVLLAPAGTEVGLKLAVTPAGRPAIERFTVCALPEVTAVETV